MNPRGSLILLLSVLSAACGRLNTVPYPVSRYSLDAQALEFVRNAPRIDLAEFADQRRRPDQTLIDKAVLVAVSGGGARAAAFTLGVLAEMEVLGEWTTKPSRNALTEIDYFSTVSGGGWAAAAYIADRFSSPTGSSYSLNANVPAITAAFLSSSKGRGRCLAERLRPLTMHAARDLRIGDILTDRASGAPRVPALFVNAAIEGNQYPFVFTERYARYYEVSSFSFCDEPVLLSTPADMGLVKVSEAVATSGSVPGFHRSLATTRICAPGKPLYSSFFCSFGRGGFDKLTLVDGGVYDNYGYQSALEMVSSIDSGLARLIIVIDSNADTEIPFEQGGGRGNLKVGLSTLMKAGFPARSAAYQRMFAMTAEAMDIRTVKLDFTAAAGFEQPAGRNVLAGLDLLAAHAQTRVNCFDPSGRYIVANGKTPLTFPDCRANNLYRTGILAKTTYLVDDYYFRLLFQLGRLVVRLRADELHNALFENPG